MLAIEADKLMFGSEVFTKNGIYAIKQVKMSKVYHVEPFKIFYALHAPAVIVEAVNTKVLDGLIKGGVIPEADLLMHKVITEDVTYSFIIK